MREIKFRAWDSLREEMYYGYSCYEPVPRGYMQLEVMQYTGLKDKNGAEIYEGDIITWLDPFGKNAVAKVSYDGNLACFNTYRGELKHIAMRPNLEVIGNIYENPELLGEDE